MSRVSSRFVSSEIIARPIRFLLPSVAVRCDDRGLCIQEFFGYMNTRQKAYIHVAQRDLRLASVRYRGLLPGCALEDVGWKVRVGAGPEKPPSGTDLVIAVKPLSERDAGWVCDISSSGLPVVVDLCDNIFIDGYANQGSLIGSRFIATCAAATALTVPTPALRDIALANIGLPADRVLVVPDIVETQPLLARQRELLDGGRQWAGALLQFVRRTVRVHRPVRPAQPVLLWFGNHGASYASFGMDDLLLFRNALQQVACSHDAELWVVSNSQDSFDRISPRLPIRSRYFEWGPTVVDDLLHVASVCLIPNSLDAFSATKSANRAIKSLSARVPVVATRTAAYSGMEQAIWLGNAGEGIQTYLRDSALRQAHLSHAARMIEARFSMGSLRRAMSNVVSLALSETRAA